jgi:hypothetical protein
MRPTTPGLLLLLLVLAALAAPVAAVAQTTGPSALWDAFPLDQATTTPAPATATPPAAETPVPATPPAAAPTPSDDGGVPIWAIIAGAFGVIVVGGGVAIFAFARLRERRQAPAPERSEAVPETAPRTDPVPVTAAVTVAAPAPAEPVARPAPPKPAPAAPAPPAAAPPAPAKKPAPPRAPEVASGGDEAVMADDLELAELAAEYLWTVATGSRRPVVDLAARRFLRVGRAREMLSRARARGILTGAGRGRPGGALTEKGRRLLEAGSASTGVPTSPPHLRLADGDEQAAGSLTGNGSASEPDEDAGRAFTVLEGGARKLS